LDVLKVHELFHEGKVAWIIAYNTLAETAIDRVTSKVADKVGFAIHPRATPSRWRPRALGQHRRPAVRVHDVER
jgi:hypothetical protein